MAQDTPTRAIHKSHPFRIDWSKLGMSLSLICAIHCLAMPFIIVLLPLAGAVFQLNIITEVILIGSSIILSGSILFKDYYKHHHNTSALIVLSAGIIVILALHMIPLPENLKWLESAGGILIFVAFLVNRKHMKAHHKCAVHP
jgi:phosphoglycerol transferase MdoB-like AlkP superfamily enzyme